VAFIKDKQLFLTSLYKGQPHIERILRISGCELKLSNSSLARLLEFLLRSEGFAQEEIGVGLAYFGNSIIIVEHCPPA
jgi:hypothetical protein